MEQGRASLGLPTYDLEAIEQNDAPYYSMNLPDYDFSELGIAGLQSLFMNLTSKQADLEEMLKLEQDYHKRVRMFNERAILKKTIMAVETSLVDKKRKEVLDYLENQKDADEDRAKRLQRTLAQDEAEYDNKRDAREKEISMMKAVEVEKLRIIKDSGKSKAGLGGETEKQLKRVSSIKKKAEKVADDPETKKVLGKAGELSELCFVDSREVRFPPEPLCWIGAELTRKTLLRQDAKFDEGRGGGEMEPVLLRVMNRLG